MQSPVTLWRNQKHTQQLLGKDGVIISWTCIRVAPEGFSYQAPYIVAVVALSSGEKIPVQVVDTPVEKIKIGMKVKTVLRRITEPDSEGVIQYGIKVTDL